MRSTGTSYYHLSFQPAVRVTLRPLRIIRVADEVEAPRRAIRVLQQGGLVAYPTDTVYGLGCDTTNAAAVRRIFEIKRRPLDDPLPILIADMTQLRELVETIPAVAVPLMQRFWPGALTLIFRRGRRAPPVVSGGRETVAVRLPNHPIPRSLIRGSGRPIVGTSANIHGEPSPATAQQVIFGLGDRVDLILDGGRTPLSRESTVVDLTQDPPRVVREGAIPRGQVEEALR